MRDNLSESYSMLRKRERKLKGPTLKREKESEGPTLNNVAEKRKGVKRTDIEASPFTLVTEHLQ